MRSLQFFFLFLAAFEVVLTAAQAQEGFEFPVQLLGFPVIVLAVRISNFVKKLGYAVNPSTYQKRGKRSVPAALANEMDVGQVEKKLIAEMGDNVCIYEEVCLEYALRANKLETENSVLDWDNVFAKYENEPSDTKKFYLLSVFLGDIVASPELCTQLVKRGRSCHSDKKTVSKLIRRHN